MIRAFPVRSVPIRAFQIGVMLFWAAAPAVCEQKGGGKPPKAVPASRPPANNPQFNQPKNAALENQGGRGKRLPNPLANPVQRMMAMSPEQRERILEKLPPRQQANIRQRLDNFDRLPPGEKDRQLQLFQRFSSLPVEKQQILERQLPAYNALPPEKKEILGFREIQRLARMPESERQARLNSEELKSKFSAGELKMISDIAENYPFPGK
jgi:Protein of unknown function (DUF3106)